MDWLRENWVLLAIVFFGWVLLDIAQSLRAILAKLREPEDRDAALRLELGVDKRSL